MMETYKIPKTRAEFERRIHILRETIRKGKLLFNRGMDLGIEKIRYLPNGRIDFLSVNESARLQANMMTHFENETFEAMVNSQGNNNSSGENTPEHQG